jgi:SIR2-like domain
MPRATVADVLECLDDEFSEVAAAFARGEYLLWLGSGISRDVVPDVRTMLRRLLEFLQAKVDPTNPECRFRKALGKVLDVAGVPCATREAINLVALISTWPNLDDTLDRMIDRYADVLNVHVQNEAADFLVWDGLDVSETYGSTALEPDTEHICVAILMMEGLVRSAPTTNWDGLVEAAMSRLSGGARLLEVVVRPSDFTAAGSRAELVKIHGCAVRAADSPAEYRSLLIARRTQIDDWVSNPNNQMMRNHLEKLIAAQPALIVGLSAQDANIHTMLHSARRSLARSWPADPPAVVFAEQQLHHHHQAVLGATYGDETFAANSQAIESSALLGAYAKPALIGLVLFALADKLCSLTDGVTGTTFSGPDRKRLCADIRSLRDAVGRLADGNARTFVDALLSVLTLALSVFREGTASDPQLAPYEPLSIAPVAQSMADPNFPREALGGFSVVISLFGRGLSEGLWGLVAGTAANPGDGVLSVTAGHRRSRVFVVRNARALSQLELEGLVDPNDGEVLVIQAEAARQPTTRSPRPDYGRTGRTGARRVDIEELCAAMSTADELFEAFRLEGAL